MCLTKIFHPNFSKTGEICVNTLKRDWQPDHTLRHILLVIRCLLVEPYPESALNEDAGKLLLEDYANYAEHARLMTSIHACPAIPVISDDAQPQASDGPIDPAVSAKSAATTKEKKTSKKNLRRL